MWKLEYRQFPKEHARYYTLENGHVKQLKENLTNHRHKSLKNIIILHRPRMNEQCCISSLTENCDTIKWRHIFSPPLRSIYSHFTCMDYDHCKNRVYFVPEGLCHIIDNVLVIKIISVWKRELTIPIQKIGEMFAQCISCSSSNNNKVK
jgi:hypothetical protein